MTTFLAAIFLILLGAFGLGSFLAMGSLLLLAVTISLAALSFLPTPWAWLVVAGAATAQVAWRLYLTAVTRRYNGGINASQKRDGEGKQLQNS